MTAPVVNIAEARGARSQTVQKLTHSAALMGIGNAIAADYPDRRAQIEAFSERLQVCIDLRTGQIVIGPIRD